MTFRKVLVANRGEIAIRLMRTLRELGIRAVGVFSEADIDAPHVAYADEAYSIGPAEAARSYLDGNRLLEVARKAGCDGVLPGYGFLSENANFACACEAAGVTFIGPSAEVIRQMGDKQAARRIMQESGVPVVPGGAAASEDEARAQAALAGYPILIKASAGGGGKGMRRVETEAELGAALERARGEAERAFGSGEVYVEKWIETPRHVEIQVLGDQHGNVVHLFERDCSIQRRHQKVVEETPCPVLESSVLEQMTEVALRAARRVGYFSAGTFEFLLAPDGSFSFIEMNTRLQVEHTITEMVTGFDLVREMIRVAAGEPLAVTQEQIERRGVALQCRVYAEDPFSGFAPSTGVLEAVVTPEGPFTRVDSGIRSGQRITPYYDPLLSKLCVWAPTRDECLQRMRRALSEYTVCGVTTNLEFHARLLASQDFAAGRYDTSLIERLPELTTSSAELSDRELTALGAVAHHLRPRARALLPSQVPEWAAACRPKPPAGSL